jgi:starch synthase
MHILFCSSEVFPFSKTGGLADMAAFLPKSVRDQGYFVDIITPYYTPISAFHHEMTYLGSKEIKMAELEKTVHFYTLTRDSQRYIFVQNQEYFERHNLYGYMDDARRFTLFSYAVLEAITLLDVKPEILHLNDWQTAMIPYLLDEHYRMKEPYYKKIHTLLTIHNLEFQGSFDAHESRLFNHSYDTTYIHFDRVNFLKAGIARATKITTVSPSFRDEVLNVEHGFTLDGMLRYRASDFSGILNGIDDHVFNPELDPYLPVNYDVNHHKTGKQSNKDALCQMFDLTSTKPLYVFIGRLSYQKGLHLMKEALDDFLYHRDVTMFLMGSGEKEYESFFHELLKKYPDKVRVYIGFNEQMAHLVYASADFFMMPSVYEPCGLGQMIAMRYGALPIVSETGGLKDTVIPYNQFTLEGTGFTFNQYDATTFRRRLYDTYDVFIQYPKNIKALKTQAMKIRYTLDSMAVEYVGLYQIMREI